MEKLNLQLPALELPDSSSLSPPPKQLKRWLADLPLGDMESSAGKILQALYDYNRCAMAPAERFTALNIFGRVVQELTAGLAAKYRTSAYPLSERNRERNQLVNRLLEEMATGFKWLVSDMLGKQDPKSFPRPEFFDAMRIAVVYLSKRMLSAYVTYSTEPGGVWKDLHQLYLLAEALQLRQPASAKTDLTRGVNSVVQAYLRIVMLAVTNPNHLMTGEAQLIYSYLNKWAAGCRVVPISGYIVDKGDLIIDLDHDLPPQFIFKDNVAQPKNCRSIDMSQLMQRFRETIHSLTTRKESAGVENVRLSFNERMRRDMLLRLQNVWNDRMERGAERKPANEKVRLVSGLSTCHCFVDNQREFFPESDEIRIYKPERREEQPAGLSLLPLDHEPWKDEQERHNVDAELERHRLSLFNEDMDIWEKIFASKSHARELHDQHAVRYRDHVWQRINVSHNGMGLRHEAAEGARISVGDIVVFHEVQDADHWCVGVVTWMKEFEVNKFEMGVMRIKGKPIPVAARAISGTGDGSEYFRALLLQTEQNGTPVTRLIVPASIYDIGTQVVLNFRTELKYIRLTDMLRTTTCYSMFSFQEIAIPMIESTKIQEIKSA
ncbi:MAG: hypothetical protein PVH04_02490 [Gammaproteobacteria bacterium]|jgi:hypothetical protein